MTHDPYPAVHADTRKPWKAIAAAAVAAVTAFLTYWIADAPPFEPKEIAQALLLALGASGIGGGVTYGVRNPLVAGTVVRRPEHGNASILYVLLVVLVVLVILAVLGVL
jgi:hypothetical protein